MRGIVLLLGLIGFTLDKIFISIKNPPVEPRLEPKVSILCLVIWLMATIIALGLTPAAAHDWYPRECCAAQLDCKPVPCESLASLPKGSVEYTPLSKLFESSKVRPSQDSKCHVCLHGSEQSPICVFTQQGA